MKSDHEGSKCIETKASNVDVEAPKSDFLKTITPCRNLNRNLDNQRHLCPKLFKSELKLNNTNSDIQSPVEPRKSQLKSSKKPSFCTNSIRKYLSPKTRSNLKSNQVTQATKSSNEDLMKGKVDSENGVTEAEKQSEKRTKIGPNVSEKVSVKKLIKMFEVCNDDLTESVVRKSSTSLDNDKPISLDDLKAENALKFLMMKRKDPVKPTTSSRGIFKGRKPRK